MASLRSWLYQASNFHALVVDWNTGDLVCVFQIAESLKSSEIGAKTAH